MQTFTLDINELKYNQQGLIPAVVIDHIDKELLMLAYMNREAVEKTIALKEAVFYSRSRQELWHKGRTSGNVLRVNAMYADCDADCLKLEVEIGGDGVACHTGALSCFFNKIELD